MTRLQSTFALLTFFRHGTWIGMIMVVVSFWVEHPIRAVIAQSSIVINIISIAGMSFCMFRMRRLRP